MLAQTGQNSLPGMRAVLRKSVSAAAILGTGRHWRCRAFVFMAEINATFGQVIRGHLDGYSIARKDTNSVFLHSPGRVGESFVPIVEFYSEASIGKQLLYRAFELYQIFLGQTYLLDKGRGRRGAPASYPPSPQAGRKFTAETRPR